MPYPYTQRQYHINIKTDRRRALQGPREPCFRRPGTLQHRERQAGRRVQGQPGSPWLSQILSHYFIQLSRYNESQLMYPLQAKC